MKKDTLHHSFNIQYTSITLFIALLFLLLFSTVSNAASWSHYDSKKDAAVFHYYDVVDFLNRVGGYMEVHYQDQDKVVHGPVRYTELSGIYHATANGVYTIRFYRPNETRYAASFYQTIVHQVKNDTWVDNEEPTFGYDGEDNFGENPND